MSRVTNFEQELTVLEKGARLRDVEASELSPRHIGTFSISPGTWVEDPITGERERIKYWYKAQSPVFCPTCGCELPAATFIKTRKHLILSCDACHNYTWLKICKTHF